MVDEVKKILNISSGSTDWREAALSNFPLFPFIYDGQLCASVEGALHAIKLPIGHPQRKSAFLMWGKQAKNIGALAKNKFVWWSSEPPIVYGSSQHRYLLASFIESKFAQNNGAARALAATVGYTLTHEIGPESPKTSLPKEVFCKILTDLRIKMFGC